jgi:hypothetical protein
MDASAATEGQLQVGPPAILGGMIQLGGFFHAECFGPDGELKWQDDMKNIVPDAALTAFLDILYRAQTPATTLYMGLVDNSGFTAFAAGDTMASSGHTGWTEVTPGTGYTTTGSNRLTWTPVAAAAKSISNTVTTNFPILGTFTIKGAFLTNLQSGTGASPANYIAAEAAFSGGTQAVNNGDTLKVTYTVSATTS